MHSLFFPVDGLEHGWAEQLEHGWAGQLEHGIVNRVRWLGNAANFKGGCYCSHFWHVTWSWPCTTSYHSRKRTIESFVFEVNKSSFLISASIFSKCLAITVLYLGCGTSWRTKGVGIFKLPAAKNCAVSCFWDRIKSISKTNSDKCLFLSLVFF